MNIGLARLLLLESQLSEKTHLEQDKCPDSDVVAALERKLQEKNTYIRGLEEKMKNISGMKCKDKHLKYFVLN